MITKIKSELKKLADPQRAKTYAWFFKTGKGQYGAGDKFLGIVMPELRKFAKKYYQETSLTEALQILQSEWHEERILALLILMLKYKKAEAKEKEQIFLKYLANTKYINNWDLVDVSCRDIVGAHLFERDRSILYKLAKSSNLWKKRIAIVSTFYFISRNDLDDTFKIAEILLDPTSLRLRGINQHDLIHKAVGWMLREAGKRDKNRLLKFLGKFGSQMPRTTLRYAIEKFSPEERKYYLVKY